MTRYLYSAQAAISQNGELVTLTVGQVFTPEDTSFTTPLVVTDITGAAKTEIVVSGIGQTETFFIEDQLHVVWRSGGLYSELVSFDGIVDVAQGAAADAATAALSAAQAVSASLAAVTFAADRTYDRERRQVDGSMRFVREMMLGMNYRPATRSVITLDREYPDSWTGPITGSVRLEGLANVAPGLDITQAPRVSLANPADGIPDAYRGMVYGSSSPAGAIWLRVYKVDPLTGGRYDTGIVAQAGADGNWGIDLSGVETWRKGYWEIVPVVSSTNAAATGPSHLVGRFYTNLRARAYGVTDTAYPSAAAWVGEDGRFMIPSVAAGRKVVTVGREFVPSAPIAAVETMTGAARSYVVEPGQPGYGTNFVLSSYVYDQALALMAACATNDEEASDLLLAGLLEFQRTTSSGAIVAGDFIFTGPQHNPRYGDNVVRTGASAVATYALLKYMRAFPQRVTSGLKTRAEQALSALAAKQQAGGIREGLLLGGVGAYEPAIAPQTRRNLIPNPGPRTSNLGGYGFTSGTGETRTGSWIATPGGGPRGTTGFMRSTVTAAKTAGASGPSYMLQSSNWAAEGVNEGDYMLMSCWIRLSRAATVTVRTTLRNDTIEKSVATSGPIVLPANTWVEHGIIMQVPIGSGGANGYSFEVLVPPGTVVPIGGTYDFANLKVERIAEEDETTALYPYFDGTFTTTEGKLYSWAGLPNASSSIEETPGSGQRPNLDYRIDWVSTEHNLDAFWAFDLAEVVLPGQGYLDRAQRVKGGLLTTLWNAEEQRFNQGYQVAGPDTADALDLHSWGAIFLDAIGEDGKALAIMTDASLAPFLATIDGVTGYGIADPAKGGYDGLLPNVWSEGTFGVALALRRLGLDERRGAVLRGIDAMQHHDGGWKYVQRVDVSHELTPYRSVAGSAWAVLSVLDEIWTLR